MVMAPVDGNYTLDLDGMMEVLTALKAQLIIPMHFFGWYTLDRFLERAEPAMAGGDGRKFRRSWCRRRRCRQARRFWCCRAF